MIGRVLGLDLGSKTCGIAMSDLMGIIASGVETYRFEEDNYEQVLSYLTKFIKDNNVQKVVLGLPKHMNGDIGIRGQISIDFKEKLEKATNIPVVLWDERLTTKVNEKMLINADFSRKKRKQVIDKMAAVTILQEYLNMQK